MDRKETFILRIEGAYFVTLTELFTGSNIRRPIYSPHKYDAARINDLWAAGEVLRHLCSKGERGEILAFNRLNGGEHLVYKTAERGQPAACHA